MVKRITVLVSDSSRIGCQLLQEGISGEEWFVVVACTVGAKETLEAALKYHPDVILLSANLEDGPGTGFHVLREISLSQLSSRVIYLVDRSERDTVIAAFQAGAKGVFLHEQPISTLCNCIRRVHEGQVWADSTQLQYLLEAFAAMPRAVADCDTEIMLTEREKQIAQLVAEGLSNRDISRRLHLSEHTVKNYLFRIFEKLAISNRVDLAMYTIRSARKGAA